MNTEDGNLMTQPDKLYSLIIIGKFLDELQNKYGLNDFSPADIYLSKNGDTICARVKDNDGNGEIILNRWKLDEFKDSVIY